ncbi:MAG: AMP-binding protein, partial [Rickettsiales bacterium]|nr:AMP-binding protein [Rickettsiales bacterium]
MNMYDFMDNIVAEIPNELFLTREKVTYSQFRDNVRNRAQTLHAVGVKRGDVVGILAHNIPEFPTTLFAIWYLGGTALLLDTNLTPFEYDNMAKLVNCKLIASEKSFQYKTKEFKFFDIETEDECWDGKLEPADVGTTDIATMSFTSGSTGVPKIVPLTHFNLIETANSLEDMNRWLHKGDTLYGFLPMYHVFGFAVEILATMHYRGNILLQSTVNPKMIMDDFKEYRPQIIPAVPRLWEIFRAKIIDGMKAKKIWWLASFILRFQKVFRAIGLGFLVRKIQKPVLEVFGGRARLLIAGGAATKPEVEKF